MAAVTEEEITSVAPAPDPVPERTAIMTEYETVLARHADRMILARRLTLSDPRVVNGTLCNDGVRDFMIRAHLVQPVNRRIHPSAELQPDATAAEEQIREYCRQQFGLLLPLEDYSEVGLRKRIEAGVQAHEHWAREFRSLCLLKHREAYISTERMAEVFTQLGLDQYQPQRRVTISLNFDYNIPITGRASDPTFARNEKTRLLEALREFAGTDASYESTRWNGGGNGISLNVERI